MPHLPVPDLSGYRQVRHTILKGTNPEGGISLNRQSMKRYTVKRTVAWLLVVCIVFASFAGADVYAADNGGVMMIMEKLL